MTPRQPKPRMRHEKLFGVLRFLRSHPANATYHHLPVALERAPKAAEGDPTRERATAAELLAPPTLELQIVRIDAMLSQCIFVLKINK